MNDTVGNNGTSGTMNVTLDTTKPALALVAPANASHLPATRPINFTLSTNDSFINNVTLYIDNVANETNSSGRNGTYLFAKTLADGNHTWFVLVYDKAGSSNQSLQYNVSTETDVTVPRTTLLAPVSGTANSTNFFVNATVLDTFTVARVQYRYENGTTNSSWIAMTQEGSGTNWSATFDITQSGDGNYTIRINASDEFNNSNTTIIASGIVVDTVNPVAVLNLPLQNQTRDNSITNFTVNITDTNVNNVSVYIDGVLNETNSSRVSGTYLFLKLSDGSITEHSHI